ncbi:hypothetical protein BLA29_007301 [Euroglyphus maynei]|uniref:Uncharacterized protein n=1 Tax=Euroglyphus maynei TaxID=6958 RepID=A0A1Y3BIR9_EURMA|nr:hypothetical protein BLA29_007301 [Euroglyphus maynei]
MANFVGSGGLNSACVVSHFVSRAMTESILARLSVRMIEIDRLETSAHFPLPDVAKHIACNSGCETVVKKFGELIQKRSI